MIKAIINGVISLVISLVNILLSPINTIINQFLPSLSSALNSVSGFFDMIGDIIPWLVSYTGLDANLISFIIDAAVFVFTVPLLVQTVKVAIKWYDKLKL